MCEIVCVKIYICAKADNELEEFKMIIFRSITSLR